MNRSIAVRQSGYLPRSSDKHSEGTIVCSICQAVYTPSRSHAYLLQAPPIALESAFMSMCHFCFRCRRPSCPACWDDVHGVCGRCTEETGLPFRLEPAPLDGAQSAPSRTTSTPARTAQSSLVNIQPGRFQKPLPPPIDSIPTRADFTGSRPAPRARRSRSLAIDEIETRPDQKNRPSSSLDITTAITRPERSQRSRRSIGRTLMLLLLALVIFIALLFIATLFFPGVNTFIRELLHIDIRTGIAHFWHLLQHLF